MQPGRYNFSRENATPELLPGRKVSAGYFDAFQVHPASGPGLHRGGRSPGAEHEVVLSYQAWKKRFGADPNIVGQGLVLNQQTLSRGRRHGPGFQLAEPGRAVDADRVAARAVSRSGYRYNENLFALGRLRPGVTAQQANTYLQHKAQENIASEGEKSYGRFSGWGMFAMPLTEFIGGSLRKPLTMLLVAVGMVLLIACANIAGLQMARASARQRDLAIRVALGAQRSRLLRQALVESIVLTVGGAALGLLVALITAPLLLKSLPAMLGTQIQPSFRGPVLLFVSAIAVVCSLFCGLVPAWQRTQPGWFNALQEGGRSGSTGIVSQRTRSVLVVAQIALSLLLLAGAGLLLSSLQALERVETGFQPNGLLSASFSLPATVLRPGLVVPTRPALIKSPPPPQPPPHKTPATPRLRRSSTRCRNICAAFPALATPRLLIPCPSLMTAARPASTSRARLFRRISRDRTETSASSRRIIFPRCACLW